MPVWQGEVIHTSSSPEYDRSPDMAQMGKCNAAQVSGHAMAKVLVDGRSQTQTAGRIHPEPLDSKAHILAEVLTTVQFINQRLQTLEALILDVQSLPHQK